MTLEVNLNIPPVPFQGFRPLVNRALQGLANFLASVLPFKAIGIENSQNLTVVHPLVRSIVSKFDEKKLGINSHSQADETLKIIQIVQNCIKNRLPRDVELMIGMCYAESIHQWRLFYIESPCLKEKEVTFLSPQHIEAAAKLMLHRFEQVPEQQDGIFRNTQQLLSYVFMEVFNDTALPEKLEILQTLKQSDISTVSQDEQNIDPEQPLKKIESQVEEVAMQLQFVSWRLQKGLIKFFQSSFIEYSTLYLPLRFFLHTSKLAINGNHCPPNASLPLFICGLIGACTMAFLQYMIVFDLIENLREPISESIDRSIPASQRTYVASQLPNLIDRWLQLTMKPLSKRAFSHCKTGEEKPLNHETSVSSTILLAHAARVVKKEDRLSVVTKI